MNKKPITMIFDFDGTLFHTLPAVKEGIRKTLLKMHNDYVSDASIEEGVKLGIPLEDTFHYILSTPQYPLKDYVDCYRELYSQSNLESLVVIYPFVKSTIKKIHKMGIPLIILSNKAEPVIKSLLRKEQLQDYFSLIIGHREGLKPKPSADVYRSVIQPIHNGLAHSKLYMIGDTKNDILFAQKIGATFCWASYGYGRGLHDLKKSPWITLNCFSELIAFI